MIAYFSKTSSKPEKNHCVTRRKLLAVVKTLERFCEYLYGRKFSLRTDHASLQRLLQFKNVDCEIVEALANIQNIIEHRPGRNHGNAYALSRRPCMKDNCKHCLNLQQKEGLHTLTCCVTTVEPEENWEVDRLAED